MQIYNVLEYSSIYSDMAGSSWFHSKDEVTTFDADAANNINFKSFGHKAKLLKNTISDGYNTILENVTFSVPLKYLSNF